MSPCQLQVGDDNHLSMTRGHGGDLGVPGSSRWKRIRHASSLRAWVPYPRKLTCCSSCQRPPSLSTGCGPPSCSAGLCSGAFPAATVILFLPQRLARPLLSSRQPPWYTESPSSSGHRLQGRRSRWLWLEPGGPELQSLSGGKGFPAVSDRRPCRLSCEPPACLTTFFLSWTTPVVRHFSLIHSRAKPTCLMVLHRNTHGSLFSMAAFKYLKTVLLSPSLPPIFPSPGQIPPVSEAQIISIQPSRGQTSGSGPGAATD